MEEDEPIRVLTREEFEAHRASIIASREADRAKQSAAQSELTKSQSAPPKSSGELFSQSPGPESAEQQRAQAGGEVIDPPSPQALGLGAEIWELRKKGFSAYEVHMRLGIPLSSVEKILQEFEGQLYPDVASALAQRLKIDDGRLEDLFKTYLPIATAGPVAVKKIDRRGREYSEVDSDTAIRAAGIVLGAIKGRLALAMVCRPESGGGSNGPREINVVTWLSQVMPSVQKIVSQVEPGSRGRQTLVLKCEAETELTSNGSPTNGQGPPTDRCHDLRRD
jgi:hypothetical protein